VLSILIYQKLELAATEWATYQTNKANGAEVERITISGLATKYGVSRSTLQNLVSNRTNLLRVGEFGQPQLTSKAHERLFLLYISKLATQGQWVTRDELPDAYKAFAVKFCGSRPDCRAPSSDVLRRVFAENKDLRPHLA
jgi:hypothetical protein